MMTLDAFNYFLSPLSRTPAGVPVEKRLSETLIFAYSLGEFGLDTDLFMLAIVSCIMHKGGRED
jgi:hypothetical protein